MNPYRTITHYKNHQLLKVLETKNFYQDLHDKGVRAVITIGNFSLMNRLYENITNDYAEKGAVKPLRLAFDLMMAHRKIDL